MEPRVGYALVGLFIMGLGAALVGAGLWLASGLGEGDFRRYSIYMSESAYGLGRDSTVVYYGVDVGRVEEVRLARHGDANVHAVIRVSVEQPLRQGTVASVRMRGVTGIAYVELTGGAGGAEPLRAPPGEPYPVIPYEPSLVMRLDQAVSEGMDTLEDIGQRINALLAPENIRRIETTLTSLETLSVELTRTTRRLRDTLDVADGALASGTDAANQAREAFSRARRTLADVSAAARAVDRAARSAGAFSDAGRDAARDLSRDTLPQLRALSAELQATAASLRRLSESLQRDPGQLLRGPAPTPGGASP